MLLSCPDAIYNNGTELPWHDFQELQESYGVKSKPTAAENLQANSFIKRLHGPLDDQLCTMFFERSYNDLDAIVQVAAYAARVTEPSNSPYFILQLAFE